MAVYVGPMFNCSPYKKGVWRWKEACHLLADTVEELHKMARAIKLKQSWFQVQNDVPHYDLTKTMRAKAVKAGAVEIGFRQEGRTIRVWRMKNGICNDSKQR